MKRWIVTIVSVVALCLFAFPAFAANQYWTGSGSGTINGVSYYYTVDYRGTAYDNYDRNTRITAMTATQNGSSYTYSITNSNTYTYERSDVVHISMTIRNRNTKVAVADLNNFQLRYTGTLTSVPDTIGVVNWANADVYNIDYNPTATTPSLQINFRSTESLVLMPDQQLDIQFDLVLTDSYTGTSSTVSSPVFFGSDFVNMTLNQMPGSFALYTIEEYANQFEGFDSYYVKALLTIKQYLSNIASDTGSSTVQAINAKLLTILSRLQTIIDNQNPANQATDDLSNDSQSSSTTQDQIHAQEQQWYQDNSAALANTGLSNYQFSAPVSGSLSAVATQFSELWNVLGDWVQIYFFVLTLSLATFILRHRPHTKTVQRQTSGGGKQTTHG